MRALRYGGGSLARVARSPRSLQPRTAVREPEVADNSGAGPIRLDHVLSAYRSDGLTRRSARSQGYGHPVRPPAVDRPPGGGPARALFKGGGKYPDRGTDCSIPERTPGDITQGMLNVRCDSWGGGNVALLGWGAPWFIEPPNRRSSHWLLGSLIPAVHRSRSK